MKHLSRTGGLREVCNVAPTECFCQVVNMRLNLTAPKNPNGNSIFCDPLSCLTYQLIKRHCQFGRKAPGTWFHDILWIFSDGKCQNIGPYIVLRSISHISSFLANAAPVLAPMTSSLALHVLHRAGTPAHQGQRVLQQDQVPVIQVLQHKVLPAPFSFMHGALWHVSYVTFIGGAA